MAVISITPIFLGLLHPAVLLFIFVFWFFSAVHMTNPSFVLKDPWSISFWWLVLIIGEILLSVMGYSSRTPANFYVRIPYYCIGIITAFVIRRYDNKQQKKLFLFISAILILNLLHNSFLYVLNPSVFDAADSIDGEKSISNMGTTSFVQACLYYVPCCILILTKKTPLKLRRVCLFGGILAILYMSVINSRATAFLLLIIGIIAYIYTKLIASRIRSKGQRFIVTFVIIGIFLVFLVPFLEWLASLLSAENLVVRIDSIAESVQKQEISETSESSLFERFTLAMVSINTWLSSPVNFFFGIGEDFTETATLLDLQALGIGQHSQILDFLAMYGLFGTIILFMALRSIARCINDLTTDKDSRLFIEITYVIYILSAVLNNTLFSNTNFIAFFLFPLAVLISSNGGRKNIEKA